MLNRPWPKDASTKLPPCVAPDYYSLYEPRPVRRHRYGISALALVAIAAGSFLFLMFAARPIYAFVSVVGEIITHGVQ